MSPRILVVKDSVRLLELEITEEIDHHCYTVIRGLEHLYHGPHRQEAERVFAAAIIEDPYE
ncbi:MAG TPA: hypothetical protein VGG10_19045 [Rhizomicrobium sp.]